MTDSIKESSVPVYTFVLHVRKGYEERALFMESMLKRLGISFSFQLEGDMEDIDDRILQRYFKGEMLRVSPETSCALKHIIAYRKILDYGLDGALILEDDIELSADFPAEFSKFLREKEERGIGEILLSMEDTSLQYVKGSRREKGRHLYPAKRDRYAGCYYISAGCARMILDYIEQNKCHLPIDRFHSFLIDAVGLPYYWSHPTLATQGSKNGRFGSSISIRDFHRRLYLKIFTPLKKIYKRFIYSLR